MILTDKCSSGITNVVIQQESYGVLGSVFFDVNAVENNANINNISLFIRIDMGNQDAFKCCR